MIILLILGLALWIGAHLFKRVAPAQRAALQDRMGDASKGVFAGLLILSVVMMVFGYQYAAFTFVYAPPAWGIHATNLLMVIAFLLFGLSASKGTSRTWLRHPQLLAMITWGVAHLLIRGDLAALILFGGLALWALGTIFLINAQDGPWQRPEPGTRAGDVRWLGISVVVFIVAGAVHSIWLYPFPG
ncbi:MAG: NnrU family protein [Pseudomonadota bacterium]